ncbi:MAG: outer membrane protein assembly factor BamB family protein [Planctomycetota bacterium]|jgi:outer membrane protein assembly factor BamB
MSRYELVILLVLTAGRIPAAWGQDLLEQSGVHGGLLVVVGCDDPDLLVKLGQQDGFLVQGIDTRDQKVTSAVRAIQRAGVYGKVSASKCPAGRQLPYVDNLVGLLIVDEGRYPAKEIQRVLTPRGVAMVSGRKIVKAVPPGIDDWTHHMYDASGIGAGRDTVTAQPRSMQWKAGPEYGRSHENMSSVSSVVSAGGRVYSIMDEGPQASVYLPARWVLTARDAFSGVRLWRVPIPEWHTPLFPLKSGPLQLPRRLVATRDRVYVTLGIDRPVSELDALSGHVVRTFEETAHAQELIHIDGKLVVVAQEASAAAGHRAKLPTAWRGFRFDGSTLNLAAPYSAMAVDLATGTTLWRTEPQPVVSTTVAADEGRVLYLAGDQLVCLSLADGARLWSQKSAGKAISSHTTKNPTLLVHKGVVYVAHDGELAAREAATGIELWSMACARTGYRAQASIFVVDGLIWDVDTGGEPYRPGTDPQQINRFYVGYDLRTGRERRRIPVRSDHGYAIMHHRCHVPRVSGTNIITSFPGIEFFDVVSGEVTHDSWIRGACLYGFLPANGLLYAPPHPCACYTQGKLTGFWAVAGERSADRNAPPTKRLEKGPAWGRTTGSRAATDDWPTYRGSPARSGATRSALPVKCAALWTTEVAAGLSQSIVADGRLFVSTVDDHTVHALDAGTGEAIWQHTAAGRVDSAPTYYGGTVLFGSRDGYVYCLDAETGELVWRFLAAPTDRRSVAYDQVESVWPVHGSVLVQDSVAWFCAGRSSYLDGGLLVYRLDPETGEVLSTTQVDSLGEKDEQRPIISTIYARLDMEGAKNDVLSCDSGHVFMRHWAFDLEGKSVPRELDHLFSPTGFLDATWFRRTYWIYGRIYVSGAQGWARTGNARPTGRLLVLDEKRIYGFGRNWYPPSPGHAHQMYLAGEKEIFFATPRASTPAPEAGTKETGGKKKRRRSRGIPNKPMIWSTPGDLQARGMLLQSGEETSARLYIVGAKGDWRTSLDAHEGKQGSVLRVVSVKDGKTLHEQPLPGLPVFDGLSAARGRLYVSLTDGRVLCLGEE